MADSSLQADIFLVCNMIDLQKKSVLVLLLGI